MYKAKGHNPGGLEPCHGCAPNVLCELGPLLSPLWPPPMMHRAGMRCSWVSFLTQTFMVSHTPLDLFPSPISSPQQPDISNGNPSGPTEGKYLANTWGGIFWYIEDQVRFLELKAKIPNSQNYPWKSPKLPPVLHTGYYVSIILFSDMNKTPLALNSRLTPSMARCLLTPWQTHQWVLGWVPGVGMGNTQGCEGAQIKPHHPMCLSF